MIYLSFIGNHDKIEPGKKENGAVISIFQKYTGEISQVCLFATPDKKAERISYYSIARDNLRLIEAIKPEISADIIPLNLPNPIDYDLVYPVLLDKIQELNSNPEFYNSEKIINITSGTPTMTACWVLLSQSGIINNARLVQSFESKFAGDKESNVREVNFAIDDFPRIEAPSAIKRQLTLLSRRNQALSEELATHNLDDSIPELIGKSGKIREIKEQILYDINESTSVLILGERGTGKQVIANSIWRLYRKPNDNKLTTLDCGTIPRDLAVAELFGYKKGAFTGATYDSTGMLLQSKDRMMFLDEIGNLPIEGQNSLLRFMNDGEVRMLGSDKTEIIDVQVIAATNKNVNDSTMFAQDLKDRFDEVVNLPPLREHPEDIPELAEYFSRLYYRASGLASPVVFEQKLLEKLVEYDWPGNIRELEKWVKRVLRRFKVGTISLADLPERFIPEILKEEDSDILLPELPLSIPLDDYIELIREKARGFSSGNMAEVDRLLNQTIGTEKQRVYRKKRK